VNGLVMLRKVHRAASVMSVRLARRRAFIARSPSEAGDAGPGAGPYAAVVLRFSGLGAYTNPPLAIDAHTCLVVALGDPEPGNRNDTIAYAPPAPTRKWPGGRSWPTAPTTSRARALCPCREEHVNQGKQPGDGYCR
jgi:hypothetical protein